MRWWFGAGRRPQQQVAPAWRSAAPTRAVSGGRPPLVAAPYLSLPSVAGTSELVPVTPLPRPQPHAVRRARQEAAPAAPPVPAPRPRRPSPAALPRPAARRPAPPEPPWEPRRLAPVREVETSQEPGNDEAAPPTTWLPLTQATDDFADLSGLVPHDEPDDSLAAREVAQPFDPGDEPRGASWPADGPVTDDGLAGLIAMLDAEVAKGRAERGEADPQAPTASAPATEERRMLRPTLASSRRQGLTAAPRPPAPEEPHQPAARNPRAEAEPGEPPEERAPVAAADESATAAGPAPATEPQEPRPAPGPEEQAAQAPTAPSASRPATTHSRPLDRPAQRPDAATPEPFAESGPEPVEAPSPEPLATDAGDLAVPQAATTATASAAHSPAGPPAAGTAVPATPQPETVTTKPAQPEAGHPEVPDTADDFAVQEDEESRPDEPAVAFVRDAPDGDAPDGDALDGDALDDDALDDAREHEALEPAAPMPHPEPPTDTASEAAPEVRRVVAPTGFRATLPATLPRVPQAPLASQPVTPREADALAPRAGDEGSPSRQPGAGATTSSGPAGAEPVRPPARPRATRSIRAPMEPPVAAAPDEAVASFHRMTGVDLGFVPLVRTPEATAATAQLHAQAFTRDGAVHLPPEAGDVDRTDAAALLGHELTHVMQQRALGPQAAEDGPLGEALEAQAYAVERALRGEPVDPEEIEWPDEAGPAPGYLSWSPDTGFQAHVESRPAAGSTAPTQRAPLHPTPPPYETTTSEVPAAVGGGQPPGVEDDTVPLVYPEPPVPEEPPADEGTPAEPQGLTDEDLDRITSRLAGAGAGGTRAPALDPTDPALLDQLAAGLYGRLRTRLRGELIADRERAGVLTEFS